MKVIRCCWLALMIGGGFLPIAALAVDAKRTMKVPEQSDVEAFLGQSSMAFAGESGSNATRVSDRVLDGFQAAPSHLVLPNGDTVYWGFKFQEANLQSFAIYDAEGKLQMVAVVDNIARIDRSSATPTLAQYQASQKDAGLGEPSAHIFVRDAQALNVGLPVFKRWLQADLLGFNADCGKPALAGACTLATTIKIPTTAYQIRRADAKGMPTPIALPSVPTSDEPLVKFVQ